MRKISPLFSHLIRQLFRMIVIIAVVAALAFVLTATAPLDPVTAYLGFDRMQISPEQLIPISFSLGGGAMGGIMAVALSHWTRLARIVRAEIMQLKSADYVRLSRRLGRRPLWIARHHLLPNLLPQFLVGLILLFPHAIMHAAGLTFLGFGLPPHMPAIGVLLSEAMRHISTAYWWLAVAPGVALLFFVKLFDLLGGAVRGLTAPKTSQE